MGPEVASAGWVVPKAKTVVQWSVETDCGVCGSEALFVLHDTLWACSLVLRAGREVGELPAVAAAAGRRGGGERAGRAPGAVREWSPGVGRCGAGY